jgi:hypothetical protein
VSKKEKGDKWQLLPSKVKKKANQCNYVLFTTVSMHKKHLKGTSNQENKGEHATYEFLFPLPVYSNKEGKKIALDCLSPCPLPALLVQLNLWRHRLSVAQVALLLLLSHTRAVLHCSATATS